MDVSKEAVQEHRALICMANDIFGPQLWSHSVTHQNIDFIDKDGLCYSAGVTAFVKIELKSGVYHQEAGYGTHSDKIKGMAVATAQKRAVTAALKEALRSFSSEITRQLNQNSWPPPISETKPAKPVDQSPITSCKTPPATKHNSPSDFKSIVYNNMGNNNLKSSVTNVMNHTPEPLPATAGGSSNIDLDDIEMKLERKRRQKLKQEEFLKKLKQKHTKEDSAESKNELQLNSIQNNGHIQEGTAQSGSKLLPLDIEDEALISTQEMNQMVQSAAVSGVSPSNNKVPLFSFTTANKCSKPITWSGTKENNTLASIAPPKSVLSTKKVPLQQNNWELPFMKNQVKICLK